MLANIVECYESDEILIRRFLILKKLTTKALMETDMETLYLPSEVPRAVERERLVSFFPARLFVSLSRINIRRYSLR